MSETQVRGKRDVARFRNRLVAAMMIIVFAITALGFYWAQRNVAAAAERDLRQNFQAELSWLDQVQEIRRAALAERCRVLASRPRIHAALEDNALDLLYPSAKDELRDLMESGQTQAEQSDHSLHAKFYRFLDSNGAMLVPPNPEDVGAISPEMETQLAVRALPQQQQVGYVAEKDPAQEDAINEVVVAPIFSSDTGALISALVVGFKPLELGAKRANVAMKSGIWTGNRLYLQELSTSERAAVEAAIGDSIAGNTASQSSFRVAIGGEPHFVFQKQLNPNSVFQPAYEICIYPLTGWIGQLNRLRWRIGIAGAVLLIAGLLASHFIAARLAVPVEELAIDSETNRAQRKRAEAELATTSEQLKRSTRYSADASHQLKSPVTVLRVGLESLLARDDLKPETYEELSSMIHQTHRLTGVIDDLLLLSRMDAGNLQLRAEPVDLKQLVEEWLDDLSALPDSPDVAIEKDLEGNLQIAGERRYTSLVIQNLLENARKYNRSQGRIRVSGKNSGKEVVLTVGNAGRTIPVEAQPFIFERFHRGSANSEVAGHGLGLNLARQLVRLHGGSLKLLRSENDWTEFEVRFPSAAKAAGRDSA